MVIIMKKIKILLIFFLVLFLIVGCSSNLESTGEPVVDEPMMEEPEHVFMASRSVVMEYGHAGSIKDNDGPLFAYIRFPVAGGFADEEIANWAHQTHQNAENEIQILRERDELVEGEINVQFDSYLKENRFVGIALQGVLRDTAEENPRDIIKTFNLDLQREVFLENADILDVSRQEDILYLLREKIRMNYPEAQSVLDQIDEDWLEYLTISSQGIYVILKQETTQIRTTKILLPFDELEELLLLEREAEPPLEPTPEPDTIPEITQPTVPPQSGDVDPSRPMVALTFDDGPSGYTSRLLDLLEQYGGRATFFVVGNLVDSHQDVVARAAASGSEVLGHSWDHSDLSRLSEEEIRAQLLNTNDVIERITGIVPQHFRPPYGAVSDALQNVSRELGLGIIYWSIDPRDWEIKDANSVYNAIMREVSDGVIILSHDIYESTIVAMEWIVPELISQGYQLVTISELIYYSGMGFAPGEIIYRGN